VTGSTDTSPAAVLADRYGTSARRSRGPLLALVVVVVLAFGGWLTWTIVDQADPAVASGDLTFTIVDGGTATASFVVDLRDDDVVASCRLRAYAEDHSLVGQVDFRPDLSAGDRVTREISTDRRATSVELDGCTAPGQPRPR